MKAAETSATRGNGTADIRSVVLVATNGVALSGNVANRVGTTLAIMDDAPTVGSRESPDASSDRTVSDMLAASI